MSKLASNVKVLIKTCSNKGLATNNKYLSDKAFNKTQVLSVQTRLISIESQPKKIAVADVVVIGVVVVVVHVVVVDPRNIPLKFG